MIGSMKRNVSHGKMRDRTDGSPCVLVLRLTAEEMRGRAPVSACVASDADALAEAAFGVSQVVRRASTRRLVVCDGRVARALEFIRLHATDRITPPDVVAVMGCRRSYADQRFRECTGHTILDEIRSRRVGRVKELLLRDACDRASLYCHSGFASMIDLRRMFKALTGRTLSQWRAAHAHGTAP